MKESVAAVLLFLIFLCCVGSCDRSCTRYAASPAPPAPVAATWEVRR